MPLPPKVQFYDGEIDAELDQLLEKVRENEELHEIVARLKFMVKVRSEALLEGLGEPKERSEVTARNVVKAVFPEVDDIEANEQAKRVYERLKFEVEVFFSGLRRPSERCPLCGRAKSESAGELIGFQVADRLGEAYRREVETGGPPSQLWEQLLTEEHRMELVTVCAQFLAKHTVRGAQGVS